MPEVTSGVFPVFNIEFKIGTAGRESESGDMKIIKDMETFEISIDTNVEEWTPMETEGWMRRLATGKGFGITLNGKRHVGDPGNDYVANTAWASGLDCSSKFEIVFPDTSALAFDCIVNVSAPNGGDSTNVSALEVEIMSDGKPTYTPAPTFSVGYNANGGTGIGPSGFNMVVGGTFVAATGTVFTPPVGKVFSKWNTAANGSGTDYAAGATVTMPSNNLTLYAVWVDA
jgi:hypothetical protein